MDAERASDAGSYGWPTNLLAQTQLGPEEIGLTGSFLDLSHERVFVPVSLQASSPGSTSALHVVLLYPDRLVSCSVTFEEIAPDRKVKWTSQKYSAQNLASQSLKQGLEIDIPANSLHSGLLIAKINGTTDAGLPAADKFFVRIPGGASRTEGQTAAKHANSKN